MCRSITFKQLIKLIHPDTCEVNLNDYGGKVRTAKLYREEPEELYKLAVRWGVAPLQQSTQPQIPSITPTIPTITPVTEQRWVSPKQHRRPTRATVPRWIWRGFPYETPTENCHVFVHTKNDARVLVVRVTPKRVYFYYNGRRTFASRINVTVAKEIRV